MVTVGGIINGGFALLRSRPFSALTWGVIYIGASILGLFAMLAPFMQLIMANAGRQAAPDPAAMMQLVGQMYLFYFVLMLILVVLMTAALRAALRPEEGTFASLRVGMDELRMLGLALLFAIAAFILTLVLMLLMLMIVGAAGFMGSMGPAGGGGHFGPAMLLLMFAVYAVPIYFGVRLAPAFALTMMRRKIIIGEAWSLSRGHFWVMFAGFLMLNLIILAVYLALVFLVVMPLVTMTIGSNPAMAMDLMQGHVGGGIAAAILIFGLVFAILSGVGMAFMAGGLAAATRSLTGESDVDLAETFA